MSSGRRIAVVGAGIAGMGAAWALCRAGHHVTLYERNAELGGNAKTHCWKLDDGREIVTGLSVLAWPHTYFHNYRCLLETLGIDTEQTPPLHFFVNDGGRIWAQANGDNAYASDFERWDRLVALVRGFNAKLAGTSQPSLYHASPLNPFNLISLRNLCRAFGISRRFWSRVFVPVHGSSFLTVKLSTVPASIAPVLEDIISVEHGGRLRTWSGSSADVFRRMAEGIDVRLERPVERLRSERGVVVLRDDGGDESDFDDVVLACPATTALGLLPEPTLLERLLLGGVTYADHLDDTFTEGWVHSDATVLPDEHRDTILQGYANYIACIEDGDELRYENTFVVSSWAPAARDTTLPMLVTYNRRAHIDGARRISNRLAHPQFDTGNLMRAFLLRFVQGRRRVWFCSSYTTPGNGHDLSLLSGLVVARALGAPHPFARDRAARTDFARLRRLMLG